MSQIPRDQRAFVQCRNCGEIMTAEVTEDGSIFPVGVADDGKCGDADFEVLTMPDTTVASGRT